MQYLLEQLPRRLSNQVPAGPCGGDITETWSVEICGHLITTSRIIHVSPAAVAYFVNVPVDITVPCGGVPAIRRLDYTNGQTAPLYD